MAESRACQAASAFPEAFTGGGYGKWAAGAWTGAHWGAVCQGLASHAVPQCWPLLIQIL